ncbi:hypothetical protein BUE80_DR002454 [Diplocarpon rosae]|nr:hypothetical protein BUE80_DR002454 [Diplocarpon rosae]
MDSSHAGAPGGVLYVHATVITVNRQREIYEDGGILVVENRIQDIGTSKALLARYPGTRIYDLTGHIVIPGLVSTHMHAVQSLFRGTADDCDLVTWMCERIWVLQGHVRPEEAYAGARLSIAEMLLGGTTTFLESLWAERYGFEGLVTAVAESGIRGCLGKVVMDVNPDQPAFRTRMHPGLVEGRESLERAIRMWERFEGAADGRVQVWFGARTPGGVSTAFLRQMCAEADARGIRITMHCLEEEMDQAAGVNVGIGCDGAPCNNMLDMFQEMRWTATIHKGTTRDPTVISAEEALEMATIHGAQAVGLSGPGGIGSLEVGKKADLVGIRVARAHQVPSYDPVATVVYATHAGDA